MSESNVVKFFENQTLFLTGGSGFLGKVIIEKILRACPRIKRIYLLIRTKKGKSGQERLNNLFNYPCFDEVKKLYPECAQKVYLINGDTCEPNLGISSSDQELLKNEVTCIIHAAANVKFDQTLLEASSLVRAIRDLLILAKEMKQLKSFVFISTAFSNCIHREIEERFYDPPMTAGQLLDLTESLSKDQLEAITPKILDKWPNSYVFAKCICEDLMKREGSTLPLSILRPGIVTSAVKEPIPGWIDNMYNISGVISACALGILSSIQCRATNSTHMVAVDHIANATLVIAEKHSTLHEHKSSTVPIYNAVEGKKLTWGMFRDMVQEKGWEVPLSKAVWYYQFHLFENKFIHKTNIFLFHIIPAYLIDFFLNLFGQNTFAVREFSRIDKLLDQIAYFCTTTFKFDTTNLDRLWDGLSDIDKLIFDFNSNEIDYSECIMNTLRWGRVYLVKDPLETLPSARRKLKFLFVLYYSVRVVFFYFLYRLLKLLFYRFVL